MDFCWERFTLLSADYLAVKFRFIRTILQAFSSFLLLPSALSALDVELEEQMSHEQGSAIKATDCLFICRTVLNIAIIGGVLFAPDTKTEVPGAVSRSSVTARLPENAKDLPLNQVHPCGGFFQTERQPFFWLSDTEWQLIADGTPSWRRSAKGLALADNSAGKPSIFASAGSPRMCGLMTAAGAAPESRMKDTTIISEKETAVEFVKFDFLGVFRPAIIFGNSSKPGALGCVMPLLHWAMPSEYHAIDENDIARPMVAPSEQALLTISQGEAPKKAPVKIPEYKKIEPFFVRGGSAEPSNTEAIGVRFATHKAEVGRIVSPRQCHSVQFARLRRREKS